MKFFSALRARDRAAVERLHSQVTKTADKAINNANALTETIRGMIDRDDSLTHRRRNGNDIKKAT